ncbi:hypothetical protein [Streptomyces sp. NPDC050560]|uniref:hypothetical protein n=1 Tax=Streptomyces sp. NPDC050560 TaxID=3365630 RepID=UPI00378C3AE9
MPQIRVLRAVAGASFSWRPGQVVDLPEAAARAWADGVRAELVDADEHRGAEKATPRSRGGGRAKRAETRG